jgi:hypothetical protein
MSNDANRTLIVLVAAVWIVAMAVLIFFTWTADADIIDGIGDFQEYLADHNDDAGKLIVTLGALVAAVLALIVIIIEVAPEDEERELRVEQAGATTIVPASALRQRLEEAVTAIPQITAAKARVSTRDKGIATALDITLLPSANVAAITQEASRVVIDTVQTDLGLPVVGVPTVKIAFAPAGTVAAAPAPAPAAPPVPTEQPEPAPAAEERVEEWFGASPPPEEPPTAPAESPWAQPAPPEPESPPGEPRDPQP